MNANTPQDNVVPIDSKAKAATAPAIAPTIAGMPEIPWFLKPDTTAASMASVFLDEYVQQAQNASPMTPTSFHESAGLALAATAIAGRIAAHTNHGTIYPNLYVLWIAPTSVCRKSTALNFMEGIARECFPHLIAPSHATPEALLGNLAGTLPTGYDQLPDDVQVMLGQARDFAAQRTVVRDEIGSMVDSFARDYNSGLKQVWLQLYDCKDTQRLTKKDGLLWVRHPCMNLIGASTHMSMAQHLQDHRNWEDGWWARFALLCATPTKSRPLDSTPSDTRMTCATLEQLDRKLPKPEWGQDRQEPINVTWGKAENDHLLCYYDFTHTSIYDITEERLHGLYSRLPTHLLKVATILAATDWAANGRTAPAINMAHMHRATMIVELWRANAHALIEKTSETARTKLQASIVRQINKAGHAGVTWTELWKSHKSLERTDVQRALEDMIEAEEVTKVNPVPPDPNDPPRPGRPKVRYWPLNL